MLWRNAGIERRAIADERAIVLEAAGEMAFTGSLDGAGEIIEGRMIDFEGNGFNAVRGIAQRHLARVPEQAETRDVGDRVNHADGGAFLVELLKPRSCGAIQPSHRRDRGGERFWGSAILL